MIEVGEYYRTESGYIDKIRNIDKQGNVFKDEKGKLQLWLGETIFGDPYSEEITKHSKDIIDLIEVGDCVNGNKVMTMCYEKKEGVEHTINFELENGQVYSWKEKIGEETHDFQLKIETILTHEQYEQNCYKVGE